MTMCLSDVYTEDTHELLMTNTSRIRTEGGTIILTDLFGDTRRIEGELVSVDLEANEVVIRCA